MLLDKGDSFKMNASKRGTATKSLFAAIDSASVKTVADGQRIPIYQP